MADGQCFGFATRKESGVEPAVVAHADGPASQVDDLHHVWVTGIGPETVVVVTSMRGCHRACGHFGDSAHRLLLHRRPPLLSRSQSASCVASPNLYIPLQLQRDANCLHFARCGRMDWLRCHERFTGPAHEDYLRTSSDTTEGCLCSGHCTVSPPTAPNTDWASRAIRTSVVREPRAASAALPDGPTPLGAPEPRHRRRQIPERAHPRRGEGTHLLIVQPTASQRC